jgi:excisionase family DNA binding protein
MKNEKEMQRRMLSLREFCDAYGIGRTKVYEELKAGRLLARRLGRKILISTIDAEDWAAALPPVSPTPPVS